MQAVLSESVTCYQDAGYVSSYYAGLTRHMGLPESAEPLFGELDQRLLVDLMQILPRSKEYAP